MAITSSTYYDFVKVREMGPEAKDWATTDSNFEFISLLIKALEGHTHSATAALLYPGYNTVDPLVPTLSTLTESTTGGILPPGTTVGVRIAYVNALGLETDAAPEALITLSSTVSTPLTPILVSTQVNASPGIPGGTYIYAITKKKGSGETTISDVLAVDIPFDTTHSITLGFDAINTYTDGTTAINIYRSAGLSSAFQLVTSITSTTADTYTDTNTIASQTTQPPSSNTFDAARKVRIDWSALTHPAAAAKLRVYVTQQTGLWSTQHLLSEFDLTGTPATFVDYLGNEALATGWPKNTTQILAGSPKVNLGTEATGAPILTANMNFAGFQAQNMKLHVTTSPTVADGVIYYDTSIPTVRARINGAWVNWGTTAATAYTHPTEESGGHIAANIPYKAGSAVKAKDIFDTMRNTSDGSRKSGTVIQKVAGVTSGPTTISTTPVLLPEMTFTFIPDFIGQSYEILFGGHFTGFVAGMTISIGIEIAGSMQDETIRSATIPTNAGSVSLQTHFDEIFAALTTKLINVLWWVDGSTATAVAVRRSIVGKKLF